MSNAVTLACRAVSISPAQKAVLMCLADRANDDGLAWPSIPGISEWTCLSRTAVIEAMKWLEAAGLLTITREIGKNNRVTLDLPALNQYASRTRPANVPVRETDSHPSGSRTPPVRETDGTRPAAGPEASIHQETPVQTPREPRPRAAPPPPRPADVAEQVWTDWLQLRKGKKAAVTETVLRSAQAEAAKAGLTLEQFLTIWCARGSQGLFADWLKPQEVSRFARAEDRTGRQLQTAALMTGGIHPLNPKQKEVFDVESRFLTP